KKACCRARLRRHLFSVPKSALPVTNMEKPVLPSQLPRRPSRRVGLFPVAFRRVVSESASRQQQSRTTFPTPTYQAGPAVLLVFVGPHEPWQQLRAQPPALRLQRSFS